MLETWEDIKNYEGIYQISNKGNVKRLHREFKFKNGVKYIFKEELIKPTINKNGDKQVNLCKNDKWKKILLKDLLNN